MNTDQNTGIIYIDMLLDASNEATQILYNITVYVM